LITGMGMISSIGATPEENREALIRGECGITRSGTLPTRYAGILPFGEVTLSTDHLKERLNMHDAGITRTTLLALYATNEAVSDAHLSASQLSSYDTALVGASTVGGMCLMDELYCDVHRHTNGSPFLAAYNAASIGTCLQSIYKIRGVVNTINTACSSSANAILYGAKLIRHGFARRAIVGGVDSLSKFTINGFNSLHILSPEICRPFDAERRGLNLGEGAAFLVLEKEEDVEGKKIYAELAGYGNANDAYHPSSLSGEGDGPYLAMKEALRNAKLDIDKIDFINAHGTGTENNDEVESRAMLRLFGSPPLFASTKSNIGHTLGASGAIEAAYSVLNLSHQEVYAGLHFTRPIPQTMLRPVTGHKKIPLRHVMSNSFGFGGNCTSLIFSKA
jgi:3-oxoacyl-(acyl-carrier-protein) synthase